MTIMHRCKSTLNRVLGKQETLFYETPTEDVLKPVEQLYEELAMLQAWKQRFINEIDDAIVQKQHLIQQRVRNGSAYPEKISPLR